MKKLIRRPTRSFLNIFIAFSVSLLFAVSACKKVDTGYVEHTSINKVGGNVANNVLTFLESQKRKTANTSKIARTSNANKNANIDLLKANLDFNLARLEIVSAKLDFLIIPIKEGLINDRNLGTNSTMELLLLTDKTGKISSGSIIYFQPSDGKKVAKFPKDNFKDMFTKKKSTVDGTYKMLHLTGTWISQFVIKNGKMISAGNVEAEKKATSRTQRTQRCTDYYLVTTTYYTDNTSETTRSYLYTVCDDCQETEYMKACGPEGETEGDGGAGPMVDVPEESISLEFTWDREHAPSEDDPTDIYSVGPSYVAIPGWYWHGPCEISGVRAFGAGYITNVWGGTPIAKPETTTFLDKGFFEATVTRKAIPYSVKFDWFRITLVSAFVDWQFLYSASFSTSSGYSTRPFIPDGCFGVAWLP